MLQALHAARTRNRAYVKSSRIVAEALRGCPHDGGSDAVAGAALYDELVRMARDFSTRYRLVDGQGNFGSVDDDPPADMRHTEPRLDHAGAALLADLDGGEAAPTPVLPASFPNLLVNGAFRSSPGALTRIAPHNLREIAAAYATGRGRVWLRGRAHYESVPRGRQALVVTHLPYGVMKGGEVGFISEVARLVDEQRIGGIADLADRSSNRASGSSSPSRATPIRRSCCASCTRRRRCR